VSTVHELELPLGEEAVRALRVGDQVRLHGEVVLCAGMTTHERLTGLLDRGEAPPIDLRGAALLHLGSYSREADGHFEVLYLNPTTSTRFNGFMPRLIRGLGLRVVGGKGGLDAGSVEAMRAEGCIYLSFLGGGCTLLSEAIREMVAVHWNDLVHHYRLVKLRVEGLGPATVGIDAQGNSLYGDLAETARERLPEILARLDERRRSARG